jgi:hypothetical protein
MDTSLYYNPNKMLSYNRILNMVIGARGIGKSYGMKEYPIKRFIKNGEQMIYLKRYKSDLKKVGTYFDDIVPAFPEHKFKVKGYDLMIDDKQYGWAFPLSMWQSLKSTSFPNVTTIIFDEFIREKDKSGYMPNEVDALLNVMDTVFRTRDNVRCICLSNSVSVVNPYFLYFGLTPDIKKRYNAYENILVEVPESRDFAEERRKTRFGRLIDGTEYGGMSLDNEFTNDSDVFIEKRGKNSKYKFKITYNGVNMGLWIDLERGRMYLSESYDPSGKLRFAMTTDDLEENMLLMLGWKQHYPLMKLVSAFKKGLLRFENQLVRTMAYEMFKKMNIY